MNDVASVLTHPALPDGLKEYKLQIAGHKFNSKHASERMCLLHNPRKNLVLKPFQRFPRGEREHRFYEIVYDENSEDVALLKLREFIPTYHGIVDFPVTGGAVDETKRYLQLGDLTRDFVRPCVLDLKMGCQTWDPDATEAKKSYEQNKYPPLRTLGFRFSGMKVFNEQTGHYTTKDKYWGIKLSEDMIYDALCQFFRVSLHRLEALVLVELLLGRLRDIRDWFTRHFRFNFYSSSILIIYESARTGSTQSGCNIHETDEPKLQNGFESGAERNRNEKSTAGSVFDLSKGPLSPKMTEFVGDHCQILTPNPISPSVISPESLESPNPIITALKRGVLDDERESGCSVEHSGSSACSCSSSNHSGSDNEEENYSCCSSDPLEMTSSESSTPLPTLVVENGKSRVARASKSGGLPPVSHDAITVGCSRDKLKKDCNSVMPPALNSQASIIHGHSSLTSDFSGNAKSATNDDVLPGNAVAGLDVTSKSKMNPARNGYEDQSEISSSNKNFKGNLDDQIFGINNEETSNIATELNGKAVGTAVDQGDLYATRKIPKIRGIKTDTTSISSTLFKNGCRLEAKMIDFTHTFESSDEDLNYLLGLNKLIEYLEEVLVVEGAKVEKESLGGECE